VVSEEWDSSESGRLEATVLAEEGDGVIDER